MDPGSTVWQLIGFALLTLNILQAVQGYQNYCDDRFKKRLSFTSYLFLFPAFAALLIAALLIYRMAT
jgi:hypothetical protein